MSDQDTDIPGPVREAWNELHWALFVLDVVRCPIVVVLASMVLVVAALEAAP